MFIFALLLLMVGVAVALLGFKLFRILLPLVGFFAGTVIGFTGIQGIFGSGAISTTIAVFSALAVGALLAVLSYLFFGIAVVVLFGLVCSAALSYLGIALGLNENGFVVFMLGVAGFILGAMYALATPSSAGIVITLTSLLGVALVLAGVFLVVGTVTLDELNNNGIVASVLRVVDQSLLWLLVWFGGSLLAMRLQAISIASEVMSNQFQYEVKK